MSLMLHFQLFLIFFCCPQKEDDLHVRHIDHPPPHGVPLVEVGGGGEHHQHHGGGAGAPWGQRELDIRLV